MIQFLLSLCVFFAGAAYATAAPDTIWWSKQQPLQWSHFKAKADTATFNRNHLATTFWKLTYYHRYNRQTGQVEVIAYAWVDGRRSWVKPSQRTNAALLQHEQGHFDLAEVLVRQLKQQVAQKQFSRNNYADTLNRMFSLLLADMNDTQLQYDSDTQYGERPAEQRRWQTLISGKLLQLQNHVGRTVLSRAY